MGPGRGRGCRPDDLLDNLFRYRLAGIFPNGTAAWRQGLALPLYEKLRDDQVVTVARALRQSIDKL